MIKAVIFDMDGVVADSQKVHAQIESDILARFGIDISPAELTERFSGVRVADFFKELFDQHGVSDDVGLGDIEPVVAEKRQAIVDYVRKNGAEPIPGIFALVELLLQNNILRALGTASSFELATEILAALKLQEKIPTIASGNEVANGKPAPDIFLLAAERLGIEPKDCLVIEDARAGMQAAKTAGMKCIGLVADRHGDYPADVLVESLEEINLHLLQSL